MESGSTDIVKLLLYIFNVILGITGVALMIIGIIVIADLGRFSNYLSTSITVPPIMFIALGILVICTCIFGFYCIEKHNYYILIVFTLLLLLILVIEVILAISSSVSKENFNNDLRHNLKSSMGKYSFEDTDRQSWATLQRKLECCGVDTPRDWVIIFPENQVPVSCCQNLPDESGALCRNLFDERIIYQKGCYNVLSDRVKSRMTTMLYIALAFSLLQVVGVILSSFYTYFLKTDHESK
ncbi:tetraspanin-9-like [Adelges cooleyi]|uniref:tetraspanin-9-like n=1 Tax=Adelges cooleyi TaxID=133065 RepID=UPI00217F6AEF|nr:tetraspanin-9-like [Adelges cooleyi]XP_050429045.1 tetraspanin-9-like [Adelges cooleyi]XP_050429046.1 tetraspanin-9-like [Adelges cooleyi]